MKQQPHQLSQRTLAAYASRRLASPSALVASILLALTACGGGDSSTSSSSSASDSEKQTLDWSGKVFIDQSVQGALVCADLNANGSCDNDEPSSLTSAEGAFRFSHEVTGSAAATAAHAATMLAQISPTSIDNATPEDTAARESYWLSAPANKAAQINPLTTLVQRYMQTSGATLEVAEVAVAQQFNISIDQLYDYQSLPSSASAVLPDNARTAAKVTTYALEMGSDLRTLSSTDAAEPAQFLAEFGYGDTDNYFVAMSETDGAPDSANRISQREIREGKNRGQPLSTAELFLPPQGLPNSRFLTEQGWQACDGLSASKVSRGNPTRSNNCHGTFYSFSLPAHSLSSQKMADVVSKLPDGSEALNKEGITWMRNIWIDPANLGAATFPSGSTLSTIVTIRTQMPRFIRDVSADRIGNFPNLNALIAARPASSVNLATSEGTIGGMGSVDASHSIRAAFIDSSNIQLYKCEADQNTYANPRNCLELGTSAFTIETIGSIKVLTLSTPPQTSSPTLRGYAEYNAGVYTTHQGRPLTDDSHALSYIQLFNGSAWAGMKAALGL